MSRRLLTLLRLGILVLVGETFLAPMLTVGGVAPDFALIGLVILVLSEGTPTGVVGGFALGLIQDSGVPNLLGLQALLKTLGGFAVGRFRERLVPGMPLVEFSGLALLAFVHDAVRLTAQGLVLEAPFVRPLVLEVLPSALATAAVGVVAIRVAELAGMLRRND